MTGLPEGYELREGADARAAHAYLTQSYWSPGIAFATVERALANSLCVSALHAGAQVGMARVVTDRATFAYLADVYVIDGHGDKGLAKAMVGYLQQHPELQGLRRWMLATRDAHGLYEGLGWQRLPDPDIFMQRHFPDIYR
ncbi:GNAT family N-acetyltransferase [Alteriqipengyuania lutimaris]|uniref:N-acetyltransferase n=1 Tax=Alteriqipengyuania lutimaris TaxID=1538146 RepID=A0A395LJM8_9SPHN|nr:GNAT family N-acetyltransferase [Alteriqipengyuania lutimaris]MBB3033810.1 N-acetylglutamate synthase-like GNAT family acetyltransferase [Alteriqipengyuania lutimaris]RDS77216.1 N-acetyltransferase [Alteriqipengyuania lutimaris]